MQINESDTVNLSLENARKEVMESFEPLLPEGQDWFSPKEIAHMLGRSDQFVRDCVESGTILGHRISSSNSQGRKRISYQVHREGLVLFLLETANYKPGDFSDRFSELLGKHPCEKKSA